nr:MAG TPA: hypothetical protein [Caudoviricetes sp.]
MRVKTKASRQKPPDLSSGFCFIGGRYGKR